MRIQLSPQDLRLLEELRLNRLRQLYTKSLGLCSLHLKQNDTLVIHCPEPWIVDRLMDDLNRLLKAMWIIGGIKYVSICYVGEEVYRAKTRALRYRRHLSQSSKLK